MEFTSLSILGAFIMLVLGLVKYAVLRSMLYGPLRDRYEAAKVTGSQGLDPDSLWTVIKLSSLVLLPLLGFIFGDTVLGGLLG
jgi:hypothetical protein